MRVVRSTATVALALLSACAPKTGAEPAAAHRQVPPAAGETAAPGAGLSVPGAGARHIAPSDDESLARRYAGAPALKVFVGTASYYSDRLAGRPTASGEPYDPSALTAAHRTLPFGSVVRVMRTDVERTTFVKINDRGPFGGRGRVLDVSRRAAAQLDMLGAGVVPVRVELVHVERAH